MKRRAILMLIALLMVVADVSAQSLYRFTMIDASKGLSDNNVRHILQLRDGRMAMTTLGNINIFNGATFQYVHSSEGGVYPLAVYHGAYHVYEDMSHKLWLKDTQRVTCFDLEQNGWVEDIDRCLKSMGVATPVSDLFFDCEGRVWYVKEKSVCSPNYNKRFVFPMGDDELLDLEVIDGTLYLFFSSGEVVAYDIAASRLLYRCLYGEKNTVNMALSMVVYTDGRFFQLRCIQGLGKCLMFDTNTRQWKLLIDVPYDLHTIAICNDHTALVCSEPALWTIDLHTLESHLIDQIVVDGEMQYPALLNAVYSDNQGGVWLGTYHDGAMYAHRNQFRMTSFADLSTLDDTVVVRTFGRQLTDSRGWVWTCTTDGLSLNRQGKSSKYYSEDGLSNNNLQTVAETPDGSIWLATSHGITQAHVAGTSISFESYYESDGTLSGDYYDTGACLLRTGELLFPGKNGWTLVNPAQTDTDPIPLTPILTQLSVNGETFYVKGQASTINLSHTQNSLHFQFASLNYAEPSHTQFRYRLLSTQSADTLWTLSTASSHGGEADIHGLLHLDYKQMPPGDYTLQVEATNQAGAWLGRRTEVHFVIHQAWWRTPFAYTLYIIIGLLAVALAAYAYRQRTRRRRKEELLLLRIQNLIQLVKSERLDSDTSTNTEQETSVHVSAPDPLITRAVELIEQNLSTPNYTVDQLSRDLCMERTGLYKKISTILDQSPSALIRAVRLRRAVELIKTTDQTITEIAERTGFYSASHLARCINSEYGCKPTDFRKNS